MSVELPAAAPPYNPEAEPFWTAAAEGRLVLPRCDACGLHIWYPRAWCPVCASDEVAWVEASGRGHVYAVTVLRRARGSWAASAPYAIAYVELEEGPRVLTNVLADDPASVRIGDPVLATFVPVADLPEGSPPQAILRFRPA